MRYVVSALFAVLIAILLLVPNAPAGEVVNSDGYVYADGFYVKGGVSYTRDIVWYKDWYWVDACYRGGCYVAGYWAYQWAYYYQYTPVKLPAPSDPEWRTKLLSIAAARDKAEGRLRAAAQEQTHFLEAVNALGLQGNFRWEAYGRNPMSPTAYDNLQLSKAGVLGNTVYGYSYHQVADAYGQTDLNALYQQSSRLTQNAQSLAGTANSEFQALVQQAGGNAARVAEILAKAQAGRMVIDGIKGTPETKIETKVQGFGPAAAEQIIKQEFLKLSGPATCVECHGTGGNVQKKFDITTFNPSTADDETISVIRKYIKPTADPNANHCPPGKQLTPSQMAEILVGK